MRLVTLRTRMGAFASALILVTGSLLGWIGMQDISPHMSLAASRAQLSCSTGEGVVGVVIDVTGSTKGEVLGPARGLIKQNLDDLTKHPECGRRIYIRKLTGESWSYQDRIITAWVPPIDPLSSFAPKGAMESLAHYQSRVSQYKYEKKVVDAQIATARADVAKIKRQIDAQVTPRNIHSHVCPKTGKKTCGSDISGAFEKFSDLDLGVRGPRFLVVISDLQATGYQSRGVKLNMARTKVVIVFSCGTDSSSASQCQKAQDSWTSSLKKAGAVSVQFEDLSGWQFVHDAF